MTSSWNKKADKRDDIFLEQKSRQTWWHLPGISRNFSVSWSFSFLFRCHFPSAWSPFDIVPGAFRTRRFPYFLSSWTRMFPWTVFIFPAGIIIIFIFPGSFPVFPRLPFPGATSFPVVFPMAFPVFPIKVNYFKNPIFLLSNCKVVIL